VPSHIEAVREAPAEELRDQREEPKGEPGAEALVAAGPLHDLSVHDRTGPVQTTPFK
jgi:hypothetical protein